jgi:hypothetical protein
VRIPLLRAGSNGELLGAFRFHKNRVIYWVTKRLLASIVLTEEVTVAELYPGSAKHESPPVKPAILSEAYRGFPQLL